MTVPLNTIQRSFARAGVLICLSLATSAGAQSSGRAAPAPDPLIAAMDRGRILGAESAPVWVMGQVDYRKPHQVYGVIHDTDGMCLVGYENDVHGLLCTGEIAEKAVGCSIKAIGTEGTLELHNTAPHIRLRRGSTLDELTGAETEGGLHGGFANHDNVVDLVNALENGTKPLCDVSNALATTEIIYACYESARRRGRIDLPLTIEDHPLAALVAEGAYPTAAP